MSSNTFGADFHAARVIELQPAFRYSRQFAGVNCAPALAEALASALRTAGLPDELVGRFDGNSVRPKSHDVRATPKVQGQPGVAR
ncbi:MAG: hypothetical protein EOQ64_28205 [Mesorhizobium sp.]|nr:MAG: hypothetical protein EOQ64_28205 [Mesorhizobium sp.]